jgi:AraC-like DNA-binding protein
VALEYYSAGNEFLFYQPLFKTGTTDFEQIMVYTPFQMRFYHFYMPSIYLENTDFNCVPDGCVDMIFIYNEDDYMVELVGSTVARKILTPYPGYNYFGLRLKPGMFVMLDDVSLAEATNSEILYTSRDIDIDFFIQKLSTLTKLQDKIDLFLEEFTVSLTDNFITEPVRNIISEINRSKGTITVTELANKLCYSERQIRRLLDSQLSINPKMLCRIVRFQYALHNMITGPSQDILKYIEGLSYSDQSHFNNEFKEFTGLSPREFVATFHNQSVKPLLRKRIR